VQYVHHLFKAHRIHRSKGIAPKILHYLKHARAIALPRLGVQVFSAELRRAQRVTDVLLHLGGELFQVFQ
jgi:hypothetical protein